MSARVVIFSPAIFVALLGPPACSKAGDDDGVGHAAAPAITPTINVVADQVDGLAIESKGRAPITLARKAGSWLIEMPPPQRAARASAVADILANLASVKLTDSVAATATDQLLATYELTPAQGIHVVAKTGSTVVADLWIGKMTSRGQMVRVGGNSGIWAARGVSSSLYAQGLDRFQAPSSDQVAAADEASRARWASVPTVLARKVRDRGVSDLMHHAVTSAMEVITSEIGQPTGSYDAGLSHFYIWGAQLGGTPTMDEMKNAPFGVRAVPALTCADYAENMIEFYSYGKRIWPG